MAAESKERVELRGIRRQPFPSFGEDASYLERVTVPDEAEARRLLAEEYAANADEFEVLPVYMHWTDSPDVVADAGLLADLAPCWLECSADHPHAVPFWKDCP